MQRVEIYLSKKNLIKLLKLTERQFFGEGNL